MAVKRWMGTETQVCRVLGKCHIGGPGQPDCRGGGEVVEVKSQRRPVNQWQMKEILRKPWSTGRPTIVASTSGFTPGARRVATRRPGAYMFKVYGSGSARSSRRINPSRG